MSALPDVTPDNPGDDQRPAEADPAGQPTSEAATSGQPAATVVIAPQPVIPVSLLTAHPGNVRRDLDLSPGFVASIAANGVLVPLRITPGADGTFRVIDGHRRLAAALETGLAEIPADLAESRAGDEPGQFLDMWNAHRHRKALTPLEEADALFAARDAGAPKARIRTATGLKPQQVNAALAAARLTDGTRATVAATGCELTLDDLAIVAEFDGDQDAVGKLLDTARWGGSLEHMAERLRQQRAEHAEHERLCRELEDAGYTISAALPAGGQLLVGLRHDGEDLTPESHTGCPGRGVLFRSWDPTTPVHYCVSPVAHGHALRHADHGAVSGAAGAADTPGPAGEPSDSRPDAARRLVIQGNRAWKAAAQVRHRWLASSLFPRRSVPREAAAFVARQLLAMPDPLRSGLAGAHHRGLFTEITGQSADKWDEACDSAAAARLPLLMLAPIVTAYEQAMTEGEGKNTWRTDRYSPCPRQAAGRYLTFLASLGYQLSDIEQAVASGNAYVGETSSSDPMTGGSTSRCEDSDHREPSGAGEDPDADGGTVACADQPAV